MNSLRTLAVLLAPVVTSGCAARQPLHFRDTPTDYAELGLTETVEVKEDGRRTQPGTGEYEWWYLDGIAKDGTVVVAVFSDNWLPGEHARKVSIEVTPPGRGTRRGAFTTTEPGAFARDRADVRIGGSRFEGDLAHYSIVVDPTDADGLGCELRLDRRVASYRPGTGVMASDTDFFAWVVAVPEGELTGTVTLDGRTVPFSGSGYHDHNWGNAPPWKLIRNWWWGRGEVEGKTVVMAELRPASGRGESALPLLYVAGPAGVVANVHGEAVRLVERAATGNDDPKHPETRASGVSLRETGGLSTTFIREGVPVTSMNLLSKRSGFVRLLASIAGRSPWYTRWRSAVTIDAGGSPTHGDGTIEYMSFE